MTDFPAVGFAPPELAQVIPEAFDTDEAAPRPLSAAPPRARSSRSHTARTSAHTEEEMMADSKHKGDPAPIKPWTPPTPSPDGSGGGSGSGGRGK